MTLDLERRQDREVSAQRASLLARPVLLLVGGGGRACFLGRCWTLVKEREGRNLGFER